MSNSNSTVTAKQKTRDVLLYLLTVSSGAIDAISFLELGKVFSAFMTGNVAFLGLRIAGNSAPEIPALLSSMLAFALGVYVSTRIVGPTKVLWSSRVTYALAISLVAHAFFQIVWFSFGGHPTEQGIFGLLGLWAFAMGMQSAAVRALHVDAVYTTAATATVIFLVSDLVNWKATVVERKRLVGILLSLMVGATGGGLMLSHSHLYAPILPFIITLCTVIAASVVMRNSDQLPIDNPSPAPNPIAKV
ncbi:MAG: YoaK family protein [Chitinophagaceae bacterium]